MVRIKYQLLPCHNDNIIQELPSHTLHQIQFELRVQPRTTPLYRNLDWAACSSRGLRQQPHARHSVCHHIFISYHDIMFYSHDASVYGYCVHIFALPVVAFIIVLLHTVYLHPCTLLPSNACAWRHLGFPNFTETKQGKSSYRATSIGSTVSYDTHCLPLEL